MQLFPSLTLDIIREQLLARQQKIAVAESVTSGFLQLAFSCMPDAAVFYQGGITAYNLTQKVKHLSVDPVHAASVNCVSEQVSNEMALHVTRRFLADWGIAITGYASPVPESGNKVFACYSIAHRKKLMHAGRIDPGIPADPQELQLYYACQVLEQLAACLLAKKGKGVMVEKE